MPRRYTPREIRLLSEWLAEAHPDDRVMMRVRLIEAKLVATPGAIAQLELYGRLFPLTPELRHLASMRLELVLLVAVEDPVVTSMARERGMSVVVFHPPWVDDYLFELSHRHRRPPRPSGLPLEEREEEES